MDNRENKIKYHVKEFTNDTINDHLKNNGPNINLTGYCHNIRVNKKIIFIVLRRSNKTIQLIVFKNDNSEVYDIIKNLTNESTISINGSIVAASIKTCTVTEYEIKINDIQIINKAEIIPFSLDDVNEMFNQETIIEQNNDKIRCRVSRQTRLDNRWLDLRVSTNHKIVKIKSLLENSIRTECIKQGFIEVHTPKIISAVSEGGSNVFDIQYFDKQAYLAQSPQLYKQMIINSDFDRVFEIGPVFRAENTNTYRHLCEFVSFDMEFVIEPNQDHNDIIYLIWKILYEGFESLKSDKILADINYILEKTDNDAIIFPKEPIIIDYVDGVKMLNDIDIEQDALDDIGSINEKKLGDIIKNKYNTDVYVLVGYPKKCRPFYTMIDEKNKNYTKSFDIMMRGNEIASGSQRNHNIDELKREIMEKNIIIDEESGLLDYIKSFENGALPHGGCGIGIERLVMLYLGLDNIRMTSLFPRDPKRITP